MAWVTFWGGGESPRETLVQVPPTSAQVYAMLLSSFLWFAICSGRGLDRKGAYALSPR